MQVGCCTGCCTKGPQYFRLGTKCRDRGERWCSALRNDQSAALVRSKSTYLFLLRIVLWDVLPVSMTHAACHL
jgi:hypothetical protein